MFPRTCSLLHGDLWSGNLLCTTGDTPTLIAPSVYYGPREMDIAFPELFDGFPDGWLDAYRPFADSCSFPRNFNQLYPLLVHLNRFGERYGPAVERACRNALAAI